MRVRWSETALTEIENIFAYIHQHNRSAAAAVDDVTAAGIDGKITDEIRRRIERDLDLEEASLANREYRTK